ncbi:DUF6339 family protein [Arthrobacter sp. JSM 101049]|uniref:DUF6339 family protein n=1 Tax=Arthrobacter sp. JSM 101049 TaxID=929097 RepID=UPI001EBE4AFD|nr:hypothetical protein [Micrococcaceae bacterium RIT 802]
MEDNRARSLTHQALVELQSALDAANTYEDFLAHADTIVHREENQLELPVELGAPEHLDATKVAGRDVQNAPLVYEYLGALDRANASDRRLWTFLAFSTYREYMENRWPLAEVRNWKGRVRDRWLMGNSTRGRLIRHGIARLWWVSSLTYDPQTKHPLAQAAGDPFAYTREAFKNEDRLNALFDREAGALPDLVRSVLEYATQGGPQATDKHLQVIMKEMTLVYGYRDISYLDADGLRSLVAESAPPVPAGK